MHHPRRHGADQEIQDGRRCPRIILWIIRRHGLFPALPGTVGREHLLESLGMGLSGDLI
jgi:hypothetical protein